MNIYQDTKQVPLILSSNKFPVRGLNSRNLSQIRQDKPNSQAVQDKTWDKINIGMSWTQLPTGVHSDTFSINN